MTRPPIPDETLAERFPRQVNWRIPRNVWFVLVGWGLAVLILAGMFSLRMEITQREAARRNAQQDRELCGTLAIIIAGPPPPSGPAGQRSRDVLSALIRWRDALDCPTPPGP